ncbi:MAG: Hpt domain-containing protein [Myxococcota bacterium]
MNLPAEYHDLVEGYLESLAETGLLLAELVEELCVEPDKALPELRALAHKLAGNGASFGFPEISEAAKEVTLAARGFSQARNTGSQRVVDRARELQRVCENARSRWERSR